MRFSRSPVICSYCFFLVFYGAVAIKLLCAQIQYFTDETTDRLPVIVDRSSDSDFGDIDGDGDLDIVVSDTESSSYPNLIYINNGSGYFAEETADRIPLLYDNTMDSELGDVDGDGDLDLIVANFTSIAEDWMDLFLNDGTGYFVEARSWLPTRGPSSSTGIDFGDVDGDLDLDIVNASYGSNILMLYSPWQRFTMAPEESFPRGSDNSNDIVFADVDGDFDLDVFIANETGDRNWLLINDGTGYFTDETDERIPIDTSQSNGQSLVDVDGDGDLDIFVANGFIPGDNRLWINDGTGHFTDESEGRIPIYGEVSSDASHADIDNDGDFDLIIANFVSQGPGIATRVFVNDGTGKFTDETEERYPVIEESTSDIAVGDVDNDGDIDLYVANFGDYPAQEQNRLLINNSTPDSFPPSIIRTYHHPDTGDTTNPYLITTTVWDNISVASGELRVVLYYQAYGDSRERTDSGFMEVSMLWSGGNLYRQNIPAQGSGTIVEYYIKAEDKMGNISHDPPSAPDSVFSFLVDVSVGIGEDPPTTSLPKTFSLSQNYPNPFNPSTAIRFDIPNGAGTETFAEAESVIPDRSRSIRVDLSVYDLRGRRVCRLVDEERSAGRYQVHWDGRDDRGQKLPSGVYLYRIEAGDFISTRKMIMVR